MEKLGWRSVADLRAGMGNGEFVRWAVYYGRQAQRRQLADG